eukprot:EG_transcript_2663
MWNLHCVLISFGAPAQCGQLWTVYAGAEAPLPPPLLPPPPPLLLLLLLSAFCITEPRDMLELLDFVRVRLLDFGNRLEGTSCAATAVGRALCDPRLEEFRSRR